MKTATPIKPKFFFQFLLVAILVGIGIWINDKLFNASISDATQNSSDEAYAILVDPNGRYTSSNQAQQLEFKYANNAYQVKTNGYRANYNLIGVSVNGKALPLALSPEFIQEKHRLSQKHGDLFQVDFTNLPEGMRQDFIIFDGPKDAAFKVSLKLGTVLQTQQIGNDLLLIDPETKQRILSYKHLKAFDANGKILKAQLELLPTNAEGFVTINLLAEGKDLTYPVTIDPLNAAEWTIQGMEDEANLATAVISGDFNNDNIDDLAVGTPNAGADNEGNVQVFYGTNTGLPDNPDLTISSTQPASKFGGALAVGDINGDGITDLIIGASTYDVDYDIGTADNPGPDATPGNIDRDEGAIFIYYGSGSGIGTAPAGISDPVDTLFGQRDTIRLGGAIAVSDINNDGNGDIIGGAATFDQTNASGGAANVYLGSNTGIASNAAPSNTIESPNSAINGFFGAAISNAGDLDGDNSEDFIVGAPGELPAPPSNPNDNIPDPKGNKGRAYVFSGASLTSVATLEGNEFGDNFGTAVGGGEDLDNDGTSDIAVGANGATGNGRVFVFKGTGAAGAVSSTPSLSIPSPFQNAGFGSSVAMATDLNGDAFADLIIGAPTFSNGQSGEGAAAAYYGSATLVTDSNNPDWQVESDLTGAGFGNALAVGNMDNNFQQDLTVGAFTLSDGNTGEGGAYTFYSLTCGLPQFGDQPVFLTFPEDIAVAADVGSCGTVVNWTEPTGAADCNVVITRTDGGPANGASFSAEDSPYTITYSVSDGDPMHVTTQSFTITVEDTQTPTVANCPAENIIINVPTGQDMATITYDLPTFNDNCSISSVNRTQGPESGTDQPLGVYTIVHEGLDAAGNRATCTFKIIVIGGNSPTQSCQPFPLAGTAITPVTLDEANSRQEVSTTFARGDFRDLFDVNSLAFKIIEGIFDIDIPDWVEKILGVGGGGIDIGFFSLDYGIIPGFDFEYGFYNQIKGSGDATIDAEVTANVCVNHPEAEFFGCRDTITISTSQELLQNNLNLEVDPGDLTQELGFFVADFIFDLGVFFEASACVGLPNPFGDGCLGWEPSFSIDVSLIETFESITGEDVPNEVFKVLEDNGLDPLNLIEVDFMGRYIMNIPLLVICDDLFENPLDNPSWADYANCLVGTDGTDAFTLLDGIFQVFTLVDPFTYSPSNDEVTVGIPGAWGAVLPTLPEFDFTFGRLKPEDVGPPSIDGSTVRSSACEFTFQEGRVDIFSFLDLILAPVLEPINAPLAGVLSIGTTIGFFNGAITLDLADINVSLRNKLLGEYELTPNIMIDQIMLGEPMVYNAGSGWQGPSNIITGVSPGQNIQLVIPDYPPTPSPEYDDSAKPTVIENTNFYTITGEAMVTTKIIPNLDIGLKAFEFGGDLFGGTLAALLCVDPIVSFDLNNLERTIQMTGAVPVDLGAGDGVTAAWSLFPDDQPAVVETNDTCVFLNEWGLAFINPEDILDEANSFDLPIGGSGSINILEVIPDTITCDMYPGVDGVLIVEDDNCNITRDTFFIEVKDTLLPYVTCRDLVIALNEDGYYHLNPDEIAIGAIDNCAFVDVTVTPNTFSCNDVSLFDIVNGVRVPRDSIDVTVEVIDIAGNMNSCDAKIAVIDTLRYDFGDLVEFNDSGVYPTQLEDDGARHYVPCGDTLITLGTAIDREGDGTPSALADGDGDDEDGIVFLTPLLEGEEAVIQVNAINNTMISAATLYAFADFNNDGNLTPITFVGGSPVLAPLTNWTNLQLSFIVPNIDGAKGNIPFRFRLSSDQAASSPTGPAANGEVEDYLIKTAIAGNLVWEDRNHNGQQDEEEIPLGINNVDVTLIFGGIRSDGTLDEVGGAGLVNDIEYIQTTDTWTFTDGSTVNGIYYFEGLIPANYRIEIRDPNLVDAMDMVNTIKDLTPTRWNAGILQEDLDSDGQPKTSNPYEVFADFTISDLMSAADLGTDEEGIGDQDLNTLPYPNDINGLPDRQVEQRIDFGFIALDFGDLPNQSIASEHVANPYEYQTLLDENGPRHIASPDYYLGSCVDAERNGDPDSEAGYKGNGKDAGDDGTDTAIDSKIIGDNCTDDEDGVLFVTPLIPGYEACIEVSYEVPDNFDGPDAFLNAWVDWDGSGTLEENDQILFTKVNDKPAILELNTNALELEKGYLDQGTITSGRQAVTLCFDVPTEATFLEGAAFFRFRLSATNPRLAPSGILPAETGYPDGRIPMGEVEDYFVPLTKIGNLVWFDVDGDGIQDFGNPHPAVNRPREPGINDVPVHLIFSGKDGIIETTFDENKEIVIGGDDRVYTTLSANVEGEDGIYYFCGLIEDLTELDYNYRLAIVTPEEMTPTLPNQPPVNQMDSLDSDLASGSMTDIEIFDTSMVMLNFDLEFGQADDQPLGEDGLGDDHGTAPAYVSKNAADELWQKFPDEHTNQTFDAGFLFPCLNVTDPGEIGFDQVVCGPGADPDPFVNVRSPSGGAGDIEYLWMMSNEPGPFNFATWTPISGATGPTYDPGPVFERTFFARCVRRENCRDYLESNILEVQVDEEAVAEIAGPAAVCTGSIVTFNSAASGPGAVVSWELKLGSVSIATHEGASFTYEFSNSGNYFIYLTVTENECTSTNSQSVVVNTLAYLCNSSLNIIATPSEDQQYIMVEWQFPADGANRNYTVEYSMDGVQFEQLTTLNEATNTKDGLDFFAFKHETPRNGWNLYRVTQEDEVGSAIYSNIARAVISLDNKVLFAYPNPVNNQLTVELLDIFTQAVQLEIYNTQGILLEVIEVEKEQFQQRIDFSNYPAGAYFLRARYRGAALDVIPIVKQ